MEVRFADHGDTEALVRLRFDFFDAQPDWALNAAQKEVLGVQLQRYYERHLNKDFFGALAEVDGKIAACSFLVLHEKPANIHFATGITGEILNVFTYTEYRFNGYATATLKLLIKKAKEANASYIELSATSAGKPVYEKLGFVCAVPNSCTDMVLSL